MNVMGHVGQFLIDFQFPIEVLLMVVLAAIIGVWLYRHIRINAQQKQILDKITAREQLIEEINARVSDINSKVNDITERQAIIEQQAVEPEPIFTYEPVNEPVLEAVEQESKEPEIEELIEELSIEEIFAEEVPVKEVPVQEKVTEEISTIEVTTEEVVTKNINVEVTPAEVTPVEVAVTETAPVEKVSAEEAPAEEEQAEEVPADELLVDDGIDDGIQEGKLDVSIIEDLERAAGGTVEEVMAKAMPVSREADIRAYEYREQIKEQEIRHKLESEKPIPVEQSLQIEQVGESEQPIHSELKVEKQKSYELQSGLVIEPATVIPTMPTIEELRPEMPVIQTADVQPQPENQIPTQVLTQESPPQVQPQVSMIQVEQSILVKPARVYESRYQSVDKHGNVYTEEMLMNQIG